MIDSLRPVTQEIWQSFPMEERKRLLRHVRSYWEVHRHRIAPEIGETIAKASFVMGKLFCTPAA